MMRLFVWIFLFSLPVISQSWGFYAHRKINRLAVFTLPPEMIVFYKPNIQFITDKAVNPDMRRYAVPEEAEKHYIDIDVYGDSAVYKMPRYWDDAVAMYTEDTLRNYGIVPYHIYRMSFWLIKAFQDKNADQILRISSDIGHYIADANVPLHTTKNYNGQLTNQYGIHGFWESRLVELFSNDYDLFTGKATYIENLQEYIWEAIVHAHEALDSVFLYEQMLTRKYLESKKYGYEERGQTTVRTYSYEFSRDYHQRLNGMVERRMRASIKMVGDFWFSCWVKAGQPDLAQLVDDELLLPDTLFTKDPTLKLRNHEARGE